MTKEALLVLGVVIHLMCGILSYRMVRSQDCGDGLTWTTGSRAYYLTGSLLFGLAALLSTLITGLCIRVSRSTKKANW